MKHFYLLFFTFITYTTTSFAQGWPKDYKGVMLQGFYWDSYNDTQWSNLESQANELSKYFSLIWVPQSGYCNAMSNQMGYAPIWWFKHDSAFGTEQELRKMIKTFKEKGTGIIEDVVINHRNGNTNWCDFPTETWKGETFTWSLADICKGDDQGETERNGYALKGNNDTGDDFKGARDIDHTSLNAQKNIKRYLDFLLTDLGYTGFRYDMVKGFAANYIGMYNTSAQPTYSVGEYWDGAPSKLKSWIDGTKIDEKVQSAAFDFALKYYIRDAFGSNQWSRLNGDCPAKDPQYSQYAVTFVDNHDTDRNQGDRLQANVVAANAYILAMPGTPCLFLSHWMNYKTELKRLILARKAAGISNQSKILKSEVSGNGYIVIVQGEKGKVLLAVGNPNTYATDGYQLATSGEAYKYYVSNTVDISEVKKITENNTPSFKAPACCVVNKGETCAFFEAPSYWDNTVFCWRWDHNANYTGGTWPGTECQYVGNAPNGNKVYKWTWNGKTTPANNTNEGIIFSCNGKQTNNLPFTNAAYYNQAGIKLGIVTGIKLPHTHKLYTKPIKIYTISGHLISTTTDIHHTLQYLPKGVYIINHQKHVVQ